MERDALKPANAKSAGGHAFLYADGVIQDLGT